MSKARSPEEKQALAEHIQALRKMLIVSVGAVLVAFVALFYCFCDPLVSFVLAPLKARPDVMVVTSAVSDGLMLQFKTCLVAAVIVAMPVMIWQIWSFISPALYPHEKRIFALLFFVALILFMLGVVFCYLFVFPLTIDLFFQASQQVEADAMWSVKEYFNFVLGFILPFGFMFELPVAVYMAARKGWTNYKKMSKTRKYWILAIAVIAAILTPPDVVSQCMLGLPMVLLLEISIQICRFVKPNSMEAAA